MTDLRNAGSFGCHLNQTCASKAGCDSVCLGFLESRGDFGFIFYDAGTRATVGNAQLTADKELVQLNTKIDILPQLQRLVLAHKLALAVLQYHRTPWLLEDWRLQDFSFFANRNARSADELARDLQTLHLSTQFSMSKPETATLSGPQSSRSTPATQTKDCSALAQTKIRFIRNVTLAKLGLALLEIGHKRNIGSFNIEPEQHDVINARILAESSYTDLGPRYQRIARRCIDCNLPADDSLDAEDLQNAVYTNVVCELESMISLHRRFPEAIS